MQRRRREACQSIGGMVVNRKKKMVCVRLPNLNISGSFRTVALNRLIGTLD